MLRFADSGRTHKTMVQSLPRGMQGLGGGCGDSLGSEYVFLNYLNVFNVLISPL